MQPTKKLYRSRTDRKIFGVCGGLADYFNIDASLIRVIFIASAFMGGLGLLIYILLAIVTPEEPIAGASASLDKSLPPKEGQSSEGMSSPRNILGLLLVLIGVFYLWGEFFPYHWVDGVHVWPVLLVVIGLFLIFKKS